MGSGQKRRCRPNSRDSTSENHSPHHRSPEVLQAHLFALRRIGSESVGWSMPDLQRKGRSVSIPKPLTTSAIGKAWIKHCEGCSLTAYKDESGYSIGYGHFGVPEGTVWTQEQADAQFELDVAEREKFINRVVDVQLTQGQFDALVDFSFNEGMGALGGSTLLLELNQGDYTAVPYEMMRWDYAGGKVDPVLKARREGDVVLWNGASPPG